jgi:hypothetical protein
MRLRARVGVQGMCVRVVGFRVYLGMCVCVCVCGVTED